MDHPDDPFDVEKPLDPAAQRLQTRMRRLILISSLTMVLGLMSVFVAILYRINRSDETRTDKIPALALTHSIEIPSSHTILSATISNGRIIVHLRADGRDSIRIFDAGSGKPLGSVALDRK